MSSQTLFIRFYIKYFIIKCHIILHYQVINLGVSTNVAVNFYTGPEELLLTTNDHHCPVDKCEYGGQNPGQKSLFLNTIRDFDQQLIKCWNCEKKFNSRNTLKLHQGECMINLTPRQKLGSCPICKNWFAQPDDHLYKTHGNLLAVFCVLCRKKILNKKELRKHWKNYHVSKKNFSCRTCKKFTAKCFEDIFEEHQCN